MKEQLLKEIKGNEYTNDPDKLVRQQLDQLKELAGTFRRAACRLELIAIERFS
jgi:hypothetical protein